MLPAIIMIVALLLLTTANYWKYSFNKQEQMAVNTNQNGQDENQDTKSSPNPLEEKHSNTLQNLSEYLHIHQHTYAHPEAAVSFGNRHDIIHYPIHHLELITPPPKSLA